VLAGSREGDTAGSTFQEGIAYFGLEQLDGTGDRGLGDVQPRGGLTEAQALANCKKVPEVREVRESPH
jgi:hypothetical protein